jgi:2-methylaconitate isomerase
MRGGSSKGLFFKSVDLPDSVEEKNQIFLQALGSPDPYERQLDGMGGGISSLSKIAFISLSDHPNADVDYTFGQVAVDQAIVDYRANCGNLSSAVGPFAVDEGLINTSDGKCLVRIYNTNTKKIIHSYFSVKGGRFNPKGDFVIAGVPGSGSRIKLEFTDPGGALTGALLPTGKPIDTITLSTGHPIVASLVDASNPLIFISAESVGLSGTEHPDSIEQDNALMSKLDKIRRIGGVLMGLADVPEEVPLANPKIAMVATPMNFTKLDGNIVAKSEFHISVRMLSMGRVHRAITSTGAMCCAAAINIPGTIPNSIVSNIEELAVGNPSGILPVNAKVKQHGDTVFIESLGIFRTARRLMDGFVYMRDQYTEESLLVVQ